LQQARALKAPPRLDHLEDNNILYLERAVLDK